MLNDKLTLVIHTCDKFSDLWDGHFSLLNKNWSDRGIRTLLVTDKPTDREFDGVEILAAGKGAELSARIAYMLPYIQTEYVLETLDDYYPVNPVDTSKIEALVDAMDKEKLDYIRLFKRPNSNDKISGYDNLYRINFDSKKDFHYQVNMYAGIWRKSFIELTVREEKNAWDYELSLTQIARAEKLNCAMSKGHEFDTLDVVRKGQLLHKSARYFKNHPGLYNGERTVISRKTEMMIGFRTFIKDVTSQRFVDFLKKIMRKQGMGFYSDRVTVTDESSSD